MKIYPVILCGGSGTRLWPLSRFAMPKQFLPLVSEYTMLQETLLRLTSIPDLMPPLVICNHEHRFLVAEQLHEINVSPTGIILEPIGKNTAPAVTIAAYYLLDKDPDAVMLVLPSDHVISNEGNFHEAVLAATRGVESGKLVTFGIVPSSPETGYGYIRRGERISNNCYRVDQFLEKPDKKTAEEFLRLKEYYWNSGMFLFRASDFLVELEEYRSVIASACKHSLLKAKIDLDFCRIDETEFSQCPSESIDYAVMENTLHAAVVPSDMGWSDVGSWSALLEMQRGSVENGNVLRGDVFTSNVRNSLIRAESRFVAVIGVEDLVVVETNDAVLVAHKDEVQRVKEIVELLKQSRRSEHLIHKVVYRPWGSYEGIDIGGRFQVKRITVKPGGKLSLQMHFHRAEHWVVVSGTAMVTCGDEVRLLSENESTYIPIGMKHRLENPGKLPLDLIEVQSGSYLGEDDIVRFEDVYQRA